jgi:hypothetical protein
MSHAGGRGGVLGKDPGVPQRLPTFVFLFRRFDGWASPPGTLVLFGTVAVFFFSMASASASTSTQAPPAQAGKSMQPLIAQGDWTKNLVQLAKTAELK